MRPAVWGKHARKAIADKLKISQYPEVQTWVGLIEHTDDSEHLADFKRYLHEHDQYRKLNFKQIFPELAEYI